MNSLEVIVFFALFVDSFIANILAWCGSDWYRKNFPRISYFLPITKAWTGFYFVLVLWMGFMLVRAGVLL